MQLASQILKLRQMNNNSLKRRVQILVVMISVRVVAHPEDAVGSFGP